MVIITSYNNYINHSNTNIVYNTYTNSYTISYKQLPLRATKFGNRNSTTTTTTTTTTTNNNNNNDNNNTNSNTNSNNNSDTSNANSQFNKNTTSNINNTYNIPLSLSLSRGPARPSRPPGAAAWGAKAWLLSAMRILVANKNANDTYYYASSIIVFVCL